MLSKDVKVKGRRQWRTIRMDHFSTFLLKMKRNTISQEFDFPPKLKNKVAFGSQNIFWMECNLSKEFDLEGIAIECCQISDLDSYKLQNVYAHALWRKVWAWCGVSGVRTNSLLSFKNSFLTRDLNGSINELVHATLMVTVWLIWQRRNRFVNSTQDDAVKILQEDLFPTVQRLTILWISYRKPGVKGSLNDSRRNLGFLSCGTGNPIDDCWRCDPNWEKNRQRLADCAIGFGKGAVGGRDGRIYVVTDSGDYDAVNPRPGTLRHAVIQDEPLWIVFQRDMVIKLKEELIMNSFKTIDGRGASVHIAGGPCITVQYVTNIIIHGIHIHDCKQGGNAMVRSSPRHFGWRTISDGDGVSIFGGSHVWVDHCSLSNCADGLIDAIMGSTAITISNNFMTHHDKVMLLGHSDSYEQDKNMQVTIAFNHFGEGLVQRMPRCRHGYFHVVNNDYTHWEMYAIGGSANPTINSQGNRFLAPIEDLVTKHEDAPESKWKNLELAVGRDLMLNGAFFTMSGAGASSSYARASSLGARPSSIVSSLTTNAGALKKTDNVDSIIDKTNVLNELKDVLDVGIGIQGVARLIPTRFIDI
ncbi:hypothetical protein OSB04_003766 [Centaurea solstitialis]|uniref:Pectate lyase n=1 Tax=Centaurea solstitialis TaxID=347529 RepID=A0AA38WTY0_9ASTR|nr:hypothetical protein OSB04_003766 [Centaurea solstitialis]